jgi:hypothetical protein
MRITPMTATTPPASVTITRRSTRAAGGVRRGSLPAGTACTQANYPTARRLARP